jgi:hypothetical protein
MTTRYEVREFYTGFSRCYGVYDTWAHKFVGPSLKSRQMADYDCDKRNREAHNER